MMTHDIDKAWRSFRDDIFDCIEEELEEWDTSDEIDRGARKALQRLKKKIQQKYGDKGESIKED